MRKRINFNAVTCGTLTGLWEYRCWSELGQVVLHHTCFLEIVAWFIQWDFSSQDLTRLSLCYLETICRGKSIKNWSYDLNLSQYYSDSGMNIVSVTCLRWCFRLLTVKKRSECKLPRLILVPVFQLGTNPCSICVLELELCTAENEGGFLLEKKSGFMIILECLLKFLQFFFFCGFCSFSSWLSFPLSYMLYLARWRTTQLWWRMVIKIWCVMSGRPYDTDGRQGFTCVVEKDEISSYGPLH